MIHRRQEGHEIRQVQKDNREIGAGVGGAGFKPLKGLVRRRLDPTAEKLSPK